MGACLAVRISSPAQKVFRGLGSCSQIKANRFKESLAAKAIWRVSIKVQGLPRQTMKDWVRHSCTEDCGVAAGRVSVRRIFHLKQNNSIPTQTGKVPSGGSAGDTGTNNEDSFLRHGKGGRGGGRTTNLRS